MITYTYDDMRHEIMSHLEVRPTGRGPWKVSTYVLDGAGNKIYDWFITNDVEDYRGAVDEDPREWRERMADRFLDDEWYHNGCPDGIEFNGDWDNIFNGEYLVGVEDDLNESIFGTIKLAMTAYSAIKKLKSLKGKGKEYVEFLGGIADETMKRLGKAKKQGLSALKDVASDVVSDFLESGKAKGIDLSKFKNVDELMGDVSKVVSKMLGKKVSLKSESYRRPGRMIRESEESGLDYIVKKVEDNTFQTFNAELGDVDYDVDVDGIVDRALANMSYGLDGGVGLDIHLIEKEGPAFALVVCDEDDGEVLYEFESKNPDAVAKRTIAKIREFEKGDRR